LRENAGVHVLATGRRSVFVVLALLAPLGPGWAPAAAGETRSSRLVTPRSVGGLQLDATHGHVSAVGVAILGH
jgi:hypothetical protein